MKNKTFTFGARNFAAVAMTAMLGACGGGGGGGTASNNSVAPTVPTTTNPSTGTRVLVSTLSPSVTSPTLSLADCSKFTGGTASPIGNDIDVQEINSVLGAVDADTYAQFVKSPEDMTWWTRSSAANSSISKTVNILTLGTGIHESIHGIDTFLEGTCYSDGFNRYYIDDTVQVTNLKSGDTVNYSVASATYPTALKATRSRYTTYIPGSASASGNQFNVLLDEFSAYTTGAEFEKNVFANSAYNYLHSPYASFDGDSGGMTDFMLFMQSYLRAVRLNHTSSYTAISTQPATKAFMQLLWTKAEGLLVTNYPYSTKAGGKLMIPTDVIAQIYSTTYLQELDLFGITHKSAADWATSYLKP